MTKATEALIAALRQVPDGRWFVLSSTPGKFAEDDAPRRAADEIERLMGEVEDLTYTSSGYGSSTILSASFLIFRRPMRSTRRCARSTAMRLSSSSLRRHGSADGSRGGTLSGPERSGNLSDGRTGTPHGSCLICGYDKPWAVFAVTEAEVPVAGVCADCKRGADKFSEGDLAEVLPPDSLAGSQAELNGPSGSPNSPSEGPTDA